MNTETGSSEYLQQYYRGARLVKTLNHVAYNELEEHSVPKGDTKRRAIALAGDDSEAKERVEQFISALGFDPIDLGGLERGSHFQPDTPLFNARLTKDDIQRIVG
jgi:predicted dinucleotide-binding enzyme